MGPLGWFLIGFFTAFVVVILAVGISSAMLSSKISREEEGHYDWPDF